MRNNTALIMIGIALLMGLMAVVLAARWLGQKGSIATQKVVIAVRDIELGTPLTAGMIGVIDWPRGSIPQGAIEDVQKLPGRVVRVNVRQNEPILDSKLAPEGTMGGLSSIIGEGKRAVTVKVNEVIGVAGFALPGNYVDIMVHTTDDKGNRGGDGNAISKIVLERILVLAIAQEASRDDTKAKVVSAVTLELTPGQAEKLDVARSVGTLSLVLRNQLDTNSAATVGARKSDLLQTGVAPSPAKQAARPRPPVVAPTPEPKHRVELIRGAQKSAVEF